MVSKSEAVKRILREDQHKQLYGYPLLPPFYLPLPPRIGKCEECGQKKGVRFGYCFNCLKPHLINLLFN
jgi:hypothetical protein